MIRKHLRQREVERRLRDRSKKKRHWRRRPSAKTEISFRELWLAGILTTIAFLLYVSLCGVITGYLPKETANGTSVAYALVVDIAFCLVVAMISANRSNYFK